MAQNDSQSSHSSTPMVLASLSFLAVGLIAGLIISEGDLLQGNLLDKRGGTDDGEKPNLDIDSLETVSVSIDDDAILGDPDAPITIVEFSDYQCPFCQKFFDESLRLIVKNYVDTGKVKIIYRDYPLPSHPEASLAAQAAECVRDFAPAPGDKEYYQMHDFLFARTEDWSGNPEALSVFVEMGVGVLGEAQRSSIQACLENGDKLDEVNKDYTAGKGYGVSGTPTFFINGKKLVGAMPYENFELLIESQL